MLDENDANNVEGEKPDKQEKLSTTSHQYKKSSDMDTIREDEDEEDIMNRQEPIIKLTNVTALWEEFEPNNDEMQEMNNMYSEDNKKNSDAGFQLSIILLIRTYSTHQSFLTSGQIEGFSINPNPNISQVV